MSDTERKREREISTGVHQKTPITLLNQTSKIWFYSDLDLDRWEIHSLLPN